MILWRAANDDYISDSASFAECRESAELYLNNPGFGGSTLYYAEVEISEYLDLTGSDAMELLQATLGSDHDFGAIGAGCTPEAAAGWSAGGRDGLSAVGNASHPQLRPPAADKRSMTPTGARRRRAPCCGAGKD